MQENTILTNFVIPKSQNWDAANPGKRDWRKRPRSRDSGSRDCNL